jgi:hypothetical protein
LRIYRGTLMVLVQKTSIKLGENAETAAKPHWIR